VGFRPLSVGGQGARGTAAAACAAQAAGAAAPDAGGVLPLRFPSSVTPAARDFVCACLAEQPGERPTAAQLLEHPWLARAPACEPGGGPA
jgi:hypothetical protein